MGRRQSRELALQMLFAAEFDQNDIRNAGLMVIQTSDADSESKDFAKELFLGVLSSLDELDSIISKFLENWKLDRLFIIDRSILRLSLYELKKIPDTPASVVIDQAVRMAKKFGNDDSSKFINGILGAIFRAGNEKNKD
ncbi:MAG: transcription antitermination factor NusB [Caldisericia bacterium]|nr:transcription antitermination factor NusB [Caldisericia bacterium]